MNAKNVINFYWEQHSKYDCDLTLKKLFLCSKQLVLEAPDIPLETLLGFCANRVSDID